ncbi:uncharacterized protein DUF2264 [Promicromonospora sp. AC04]|uniref:DUF2264 domain-containing protein n=1 Tax=Promicromonospora sp. AC04 TaxID=2135723 RepID=UPI000D36FBF2|nr:DUF2264 domain-containing protein [Promicromonospora sp. AC04]PUB24950.1 uncharacterized protein DUF2264 [Promicromonospora sp. AC04]
MTTKLPPAWDESDPPRTTRPNAGPTGESDPSRTTRPNAGPTAWPPRWGAAPVSDLDTSPLTGLTRDHWIAAADGLLRSAARQASASGARITPDGRPSWNGPDSDALEGYARTFLLLGWRLSGTGGVDPESDPESDPEVDPELVAAYTSGLVAGTDARHPDAWPRISPDCIQALVEAASVALALHQTRPWIWDRLLPEQRDVVVGWLLGAFTMEVPDNNWHWFRVVVATFVATTGYPLSADQHEVVDADLARIEEFYVGDGWYRDGAGEGDRFDHYAGWAMHFYPVLWHRMCESLDATSPIARRSVAMRETHRARLVDFLADYQHLVGADGAPLFLGRSLTYRWAAATAPLAAVVDGASSWSPGLTRHLASAMLRYFLDRGAIGSEGLPSLGWFGPYPPMIQGYSAPSSPFWLSKAFVCLLIDAEDPFWTAVEEPLPAAMENRVRTMPRPGLVVSSTADDGIVRVANHGTDNHRPGVPDDPLYSRLAYSTATAPVLGPVAPVVPDNHVGLVSGGRISRRGRIHRTVPGDGRVGDGFAGSWHVPTWVDDGVVVEATGARIETVSVLEGPWELRIHRVEADEGSAVLDSGWAVADDVPPRVERVGRQIRVIGRGGLVSVLMPVLGQADEPSAEPSAEPVVEPSAEPVVEDAAGGSPLGPFVRVPSVTTPRRPGAVSVHAVLVGLAGSPSGLVLDRDPEVVVEEAGGAHLVRVTMPSGSQRLLVLDSGRHGHVPPVSP